MKQSTALQIIGFPSATWEPEDQKKLGNQKKGFPSATWEPEEAAQIKESRRP
jgi:hypothetical protein